MKVVILAGGVGSRLSEETDVRPKPMVEIGGRPILWHIMKHYSHYGFHDFVLCLGYKGDMIKRYFADMVANTADMTVDLSTGTVERHPSDADQWRVTLIDTGQTTETGGRMLRIRDHIDGPFLMTYGDGVADLDIGQVVDFHRTRGRLATVTAVHPPARFGRLQIEGDEVHRFDEKPRAGEGWVNGGFFVLEPEVLDYIPGDVDWAKEPLEGLASQAQLSAYQHEGFWQCMDTLRDKLLLEKLWESGEAPWRVW